MYVCAGILWTLVQLFVGPYHNITLPWLSSVYPKVLKSSSIRFPTLLFFLKYVLSILGPLYFYIFLYKFQNQFVHFYN